jgi:hypothetical protein
LGNITFGWEGEARSDEGENEKRSGKADHCMGL